MSSSTPCLTILPAIDIQGGMAVRLLRGALDDKTEYGTPVSIAEDFARIYTELGVLDAWVHLVDLDAAFGKGDNTQVITEVVQILTSSGINVELSGGIRNDESLERAINQGAQRVNVGTAALEDPLWTSKAVSKYGDKLAIGLDTRGEILAARGWTKDGGNIWEVAKRLLDDGVSRFVITDVTKDGTLSGPNTDLLTDAATFAKANSKEHAKVLKITASGGISSLDDLTVLRDLVSKTNGVVDSAIFGKALYAGKFTLSEALEVAGQVH